MVDQILQEIERKGFCYLQNVLDRSELASINEFFETHKNEFEAAKVGIGDNKQRVETIRGDYTFWLDPIAPDESFRKIIAFVEELKNKLNEKFFLGLKQFECHLARYPQGTFYKKHLDRFETNSSRSVSFIFYVHEAWSPENGGELVLYDKGGDVIETVVPRPGSFICFMSDEFPHEVRPATRERRSLTGWMHTKLIY